MGLFLSVKLAVTTRRYALFTAEEFDEVRRIVKATGKRNVGNAVLGVGEHIGSHVDAVVDQIFHGGAAGNLFKVAAKIVGGKIGSGGHFRQRQLMGIIVLDQCEYRWRR